MGQQHSKVTREKDDSERGSEKKFQNDVLKLKKKNERKENQSCEGKDENERRKEKLYSADQETVQTEKRAEKIYPSSARSTESVAGYRTMDKDKTDSDRDEVCDKGNDILERTDNGEYVYLHSKPLNRTTNTGPVDVDFVFLDTGSKPFMYECHHLNKNDPKNALAMKENTKTDGLKPKASIHVQEEDMNPEFIDIHVRLTRWYIRYRGSPDFASNEGQVQQDDCGSEERKINVSINNEKYTRGTTGNTSNTAEKKLSDTMIKIHQEKLMKNAVTRTNDEMDTNNQTATSKLGIYVLYDKRFCEDVMCVENLIRLKGKELRKFTADCIDRFRVYAFSDIINRQSYARVYAIGFKAGSMLMRTFEDVHIIKYILRRQDLRGRYLEYEYFRLATFSLSVFDYEMGERMRLAGGGFFCDADGSVKCFCCGNTYRPELPNSHHPDCASRSSDGHVGRSIADYYGASAPSRLVPSGQNLQEEYRTPTFIDIYIRLTTTSYRLGGTRQFTQDDALTQGHEEDESRDFSVRERPTNVTQEPRHDANIDVSMLANCFRNMDQRNENRTRVSTSRAVEDAHAHVGYSGVPPNNCQRTIKEDVNRENVKGSKDQVKRCNVVIGNERLGYRPMCCKCHINQCSVEFVPCGHLVVCDRCVSNTTKCPKCGKTVDEGHHVSD